MKKHDGVCLVENCSICKPKSTPTNQSTLKEIVELIVQKAVWQKIGITPAADQILSEIEKRLPEIEYHTHDSILVATGEERDGCVTCIKNVNIKEIKSALGLEETKEECTCNAGSDDWGTPNAIPENCPLHSKQEKTHKLIREMREEEEKLGPELPEKRKEYRGFLLSDTINQLIDVVTELRRDRC